MRRLSALIAAGLMSAALFAGDNPKKIVTFAPGFSAGDRQASVADLGGKVLKDFDFISAALVEFPAAVADKVDGYVKNRMLRGAVAVEDDEYRKWISETAMPELPSVPELLSSARKISADNENIPDARPANGEIPWGVAQVMAPQAWSRITGQGVKVAIVDTGVDLTHPDLKANIVASYSATGAANGQDQHGHGTHVAGTIGAVLDNKGVVGVAPKASLYAVQVLDKNGSGTLSAIVDGIGWCVKNKIDVINMSLGSPENSNAIHDAVKQAHDAGITVVCAAGNDSGPVNYPAAYPEAIAISAGDSSNRIAYFSSRGQQIEFIAPGVSIYSTYKGGRYTSMDGTSMASPHVAGLAALAISAGARTPDEVKAKLEAAAEKLPGLSPAEQGKGLIHADRIK